MQFRQEIRFVGTQRHRAERRLALSRVEQTLQFRQDQQRLITLPLTMPAADRVAKHSPILVEHKALLCLQVSPRLWWMPKVPKAEAQMAVTVVVRRLRFQ